MLGGRRTHLSGGNDERTKRIDDQLRVILGEIRPGRRFRHGRRIGTYERENLLLERPVIGLITDFKHLDGVVNFQYFQHGRFSETAEFVQIVAYGATEQIDRVQMLKNLVVRRRQSAGVNVDEHRLNGGRIEIVDVEISRR